MAYTKDKSYYAGYPYFASRELYELPFTQRMTIRYLKVIRTGISNPKWRDQVRLQQNATTPFSGQFDTIVSQPGTKFCRFRNDFNSNSKVYTNRAWGHYAVPHLFAGPDFGGVSTTVANNRAMQAFLKHVRATQVSFSSPTFLGELAETLRMIKNPAQGLRSLAESWLTQVKRGKARNPKNWKKNLSGAWLEQAFGWTPLIADVKNAYKAYESLATRESQAPVHGFGKEDIPVMSLCASGSKENTPTTVNFHSWNRKVYDQAIVKYRGMVKQECNATLWENKKLFGFTAEEFLPTAWELLPWSFLIDYFTNVGDVLGNIVTDTSALAWVNVSKISLRTYEVSTVPNRIPINTETGCGAMILEAGGLPAAAKAERRFVDRTSNVGTFIPPLEFSLPGKPVQWCNMLALFTQATLIHPQRGHTGLWSG